MSRGVREGSGGVLLVASLAVLAYGVVYLRSHDYVASLVLVVIGLALLGASVELLRSSAGE